MKTDQWIVSRRVSGRGTTRRRVAAGAVTSLLLVVGTATGAGAAVAADSSTQAAAAEPAVTRLAGADRYATAAAIARAAYPASNSPVGSADVVIARGDAFPDALSGVNIAGSAAQGAGPVVLTGRDQLPAAGAGVIDYVGADNAVIMGSADVVGAGVETQVKSQVEGLGAVSRVQGADRYETNWSSFARAYNAEGDAPARVDGQGTAFLVSGTSFADAISAGSVSFSQRVPLLMTDPASLSDTVKQALAYRRDIGQVVVVGGPQAVSEQVVSQLRALGVTVRRVAGVDRQETAVKMYDFAHEEFGWTPARVTLARGDDFADAVAGAGYAGRRQSPILLTGDPQHLSASTKGFFTTHAGAIKNVTVLGDSTAVSDAVVAEAVAAS